MSQKAVNYVGFSKAAFWSSQSFIDDFYQSNTLQCRIKHSHVQYLEEYYLVVTSSAVDKIFEIFGPIFEQNVTINFEPIFEQNVTINFEPIFEQNANFGPIIEKKCKFRTFCQW